jgi:hypothetical protein
MQMMKPGRRVIASALALAAVGGSASTALADYTPRKGNWVDVEVLKTNTGTVDFQLSAGASYPATCTESLNYHAVAVEKSNGYVWTDANFIVMSTTPNQYATVKHEVLGFICRFVSRPSAQPPPVH